jgi:hypothetical protein
MNIFSITEDAKSYKKRVHVYRSILEMRKDSLRSITNIHRVIPMTSEEKKRNQSLNEKFIAKVQAKVDFLRYDLIVLHIISGGPPFGTYRYARTSKDTIEFCIDQKPGNGPRGMALQYTDKMYVVPKGTNAVFCQ